MKAGCSLTVLFVYGTLLPGDVRWPLLARWALDEGRVATVAGQLYDTGAGYPCATFGGGGIVPGRVVPLDPVQVGQALTFLDGVEGVDTGLYARVVVRTDAGEPAWSYAWGGDVGGLVRIDRWLSRQ